MTAKLRPGIIIISETATKDPTTDRCGPLLQEVFSGSSSQQWDAAEVQIIPDDVLQIQQAITRWTDGESPINLIVTSGGTGFTTKDVTPEVRATPFSARVERPYGCQPLSN